MNDLKQKLIEFGMFEKEAEAYLKLLPKGEALIEDLIEQDAEYSDILVALDSLADKALINKVLVLDKIYYKAEDPEIVLKNLKIKIAQAEASKEKIDQVMLNLNWLCKQTEKPVKLFEGYEGVLEVRKKIFTEIYNNFYNLTSLHQNIPQNHIQSLLSHVKDSIYLIIPESDKNNLNSIKGIIEKESKLKIKLIDDKFWQQKQEVLIFNQIVAVGNIADEQFFTMIEDKNFSQAMKNIFMTIWAAGREYK